jgi:hypothetical protein
MESIEMQFDMNKSGTVKILVQRIHLFLKTCY